MSTQNWVLKTEGHDRDFITGREVKRQEFMIWGYTAAAVKANPAAILNSSGQGLPGPGSGGIGGTGGVKLDNYSVTANNDGTVSAIATFSNFGFGTFPPDPIQDRIGYAEWAGEQWSGVLEFPLAKRRSITHSIPTPFGSTAVIIDQWEPTTIKVRIGSERIKYRVTVQSFGAGERRLLRAQHNKLHLINDGGTPKYYLFEVGNYAQQDSGAWFIDYSWTREEGLARFDISTEDEWEPGGGGTVFVPPTRTASQIADSLPEWGELLNESGDEAQWVVPPFHTAIIDLNTSLPFAEQVKYSSVLTYDIDNLGWQTLPGLA